MKKEDIKLSDIERILFGNAPVEFLLEVLVRSVITYVVLIFVLKWMGKRMSGKLTNTETAVMLMFGAVVSSGMQIPDRGIGEACFVLLLMLAFQRGYTLIAVRNRKIEKFTLGRTSLIVKDGVVQADYMRKEFLSMNEIMRSLRAKSVYNLGQVRRFYMEASGNFTLIKFQDQRPGLCLLPPDEELEAAFVEPQKGLSVCAECGKPYPPGQWPGRCDNCGGDHDTTPVTSK